jgi:hypothetical protein
MADLYLDNQPGASFRAELNQIIEALATNNGGTVEPVPAFPSMWFANWTTNMLRRRRKDNTAWLDVSPIDEALLKATTAEVIDGIENTKAVTSATLHQARNRVAGDCYFRYLSPSQCRLDPDGGDKITIDAKLRTIPAAGIVLNYQGAWGPAYSLLYVYAQWTGTDIELFVTGTGPQLDLRDGNVVMTGNNTATLVGAFVVGGQFVDIPNQLGVISWHNKRWRSKGVSFSNVQTASATPVALTAAAISFCHWSKSAAIYMISGHAANNTTAGGLLVDPHLNGVSQGAHVAAYSAFAGQLVGTTCGWINNPGTSWSTASANIQILTTGLATFSGTAWLATWG